MGSTVELSGTKLGLALCLDEVRILIFDDPAELCERQRPGSGSWEGKLSNARGRAARAMHEFFFENLRNPAHNRRAGLMRQFSSGQLYSTTGWVQVYAKFSTHVSGYSGPN